MSAPTNFFDEPQAAAVLKHGILRRYLRPFVSKTGSTSKGRRVAYIDGYAGRGTYANGSPGSPLLAMEIAQIVSSFGTIDGHLVEQDSASYDELKALVDGSALGWSVYKGDVAEHLDDILAEIGDAPLFAFLDPFGLGLPVHMIEDKLLSRAGQMRGGRRVQGVATEVLLNFSWSGLRRNAGHLTSTSLDPAYLAVTRKSFIERTDAALGGDWWHHYWTAFPPGQREHEITEGFLNRLRQCRGGWRVVSVPVSDRWRGPIDYHLILLTQHPDGEWIFHEALSNAMEEYRTFCFRQSGELDFEPLDARRAEWVSEIKMNVVRLLEAGPFVVGERMREVYGATLTFARAMDVKEAVTQLHAEGKTDTKGTGDAQRMRVVPSTQLRLL